LGKKTPTDARAGPGDPYHFGFEESGGDFDVAKDHSCQIESHSKGNPQGYFNQPEIALLGNSEKRRRKRDLRERINPEPIPLGEVGLPFPLFFGEVTRGSQVLRQLQNIHRI
jgi:hypothetical protein